MESIIQLRISLNRTSPEIWRRILVQSSVKFFDLHHIIQISMGWKNSHLFEFQVGDYRIGYIDPNEAFEDIADASGVPLDLLFEKEGLQFTYIYDFGDNWQHSVEVEKILAKEEARVYPFCAEGQLACPPEDIGGIHGFYESLKILKDQKHTEHESVKRWLGRAYDPEKFNIGKVNRELPNFKSYMKHWR